MNMTLACPSLAVLYGPLAPFPEHGSAARGHFIADSLIRGGELYLGSARSATCAYD